LVIFATIFEGINNTLVLFYNITLIWLELYEWCFNCDVNDSFEIFLSWLHVLAYAGDESLGDAWHITTIPFSSCSKSIN
jgi:hypothetical protein